jgi:hypothetical protein
MVANSDWTFDTSCCSLSMPRYRVTHDEEAEFVGEAVLALADALALCPAAPTVESEGDAEVLAEVDALGDAVLAVGDADCDGLAEPEAEAPEVMLIRPSWDDPSLGAMGMFPVVDGSDTEEPWPPLESTSAHAVPTDIAAARATNTAILPSRLVPACRVARREPGARGGAPAVFASAVGSVRTTGIEPEVESAARTSAMSRGTVRSSGPWFTAACSSSARRNAEA